MMVAGIFVANGSRCTTGFLAIADDAPEQIKDLWVSVGGCAADPGFNSEVCYRQATVGVDRPPLQ